MGQSRILWATLYLHSLAQWSVPRWMLAMLSHVVLVSILLEEWNRSEVKFIKILKSATQKPLPRGPMRGI